MNKLLLAIIVGVVAAVVGVVLWGDAMADVYWLGELFLKSLKMIIVPLVVFSMISGITALGDVRRLGRLGGRTVLYFAVTTAIAVVVGALAVNLLQPGSVVPPESVAGLTVPEKVAGKEDFGPTQIILSFVSDNIVESAADMQLLPLILFSLVFGGVLTTLGDRGKAVIDFFDGGNEAMMKIVHLVMWLAPIGIFGLVAGRFGTAILDAEVKQFVHAVGSDPELLADKLLAGRMGDIAAGLSGGLDPLWKELRAVGLYMMTVITALAVHACIVLPAILYVTTKRSPWRYAVNMMKALITAFSTATSSGTLPITLECAEENGVDKRAANFVIPLGATVNMNGTALYEAVAVIFIAQALPGVDLSMTDQIVIIITATLAAVGAAGIPEAGTITMVIVLKAAGLPLEGIGLIIAVDWLLDRFRTAVNIWGDAVGAAVVEKYAKDQPGDSPVPAQG